MVHRTTSVSERAERSSESGGIFDMNGFMDCAHIAYGRWAPILVGVLVACCIGEILILAKLSELACDLIGK